MSFDLLRRCPIHFLTGVVCRLLIVAFLAAVATSYDPGSRFDENFAELIKNPFNIPHVNSDSGFEGVFEDDSKTNGPIDPQLEATFNYRVQSPSQLCPKKYAMLYLLTKDVKYLKDCGKFLGVPDMNSTSPVTQTEAPAPSSYSGNILKRILQNMDAGTIKTDFYKQRAPVATKRARLSVNSALSSLADMLRSESGGRREPVYAFHREMLKMG